MLRLGGMAKGDIRQCLKELEESKLDEGWKLKQIRSLLRFFQEVGGLVEHIKGESGFAGDSTSYLEILCAKEEADLIRRVSHTRVLRQDFDEKRLEWRKQKKSVISAIGTMTARVLRFEDKERKTIALYALEFYKNIMGRDDGAILGESEGTDSLVDQYRRHRSEISKIPMYADSILRMLKDIRKTVRASAKLQPGSNVFAQFLDEWWSSVVRFLQHSSIVDAEKNAREVMQTLKKLKGKQEENKKREISRLLSKLEDHTEFAAPVGRLSELLMPPPQSELLLTANPEDSDRWEEELRSRPSQHQQRHHHPQQQGIKRDRDSQSSEESAAAATDIALTPATVAPGDGSESCPETHVTVARLGGGYRQQQQRRASATTSSGGCRVPVARGTPASPPRMRVSTLSVCVENGDGDGHVGHRGGGGVRSPASMRSAASVTPTGGGGGGGGRVSWDEGSVGTTGTFDTVELPGFSGSGIPDSEGETEDAEDRSAGDGHDGDDDDDDDDDDDLFVVADDLDLGAVDLCATGMGADGQTTYRDQDELHLPSSIAELGSKNGVEQERFSAALDFFRQEQKGRRPPVSPRPSSPMRSMSANRLSSPLMSSSAASAFTRKMMGGASGMRVRTGIAVAKGSKAATPSGRRRISAERESLTSRQHLAAETSSRGKSMSRSLSVYIPRSQKSTTPRSQKSTTPQLRSSKTPTAKTSRRALPSPGGPSSRGYSRGVFFA